MVATAPFRAGGPPCQASARQGGPAGSRWQINRTARPAPPRHGRAPRFILQRDMVDRDRVLIRHELLDCAVFRRRAPIDLTGEHRRGSSISKVEPTETRARPARPITLAALVRGAE